MSEHFVVRNLARDPASRTKRRLRPGNKTGFLLADGTRIRRKNVRGTMLPMAKARANMATLAQGVKDGYIEVRYDGEVVPHEALSSAAKDRAQKPELKVPEPKPEPVAPPPEPKPEPVATAPEPASDTEVALPPMPEPDSKKKSSRKKKES